MSLQQDFKPEDCIPEDGLVSKLGDVDKVCVWEGGEGGLALNKYQRLTM